MRRVSRRILIGISSLFLLLNMLPNATACLCERTSRPEATSARVCCDADVPPCCATSTGPCPRMQAPLPTHSLTNTCACQSPGASHFDDALLPSIGSHAKQLASADLEWAPIPGLSANVDPRSTNSMQSRTPNPLSVTPLYLQNAVLRI